MDAACTAKRLGAEETIVVYRRTRDRMPAHDIEVRGGAQEGVSGRVAVDDQAWTPGSMTIGGAHGTRRHRFRSPPASSGATQADSLVPRRDRPRTSP